MADAPCVRLQAPGKSKVSTQNERTRVLFLSWGIRCFLQLAAGALAPFFVSSAVAVETNLAKVAGVEIGAYNTRARTVTLVSSNGVRATVVPPIGGRIVNY